MTDLSKLVTRWRARAAAQPSDRGLRSAVAEALDHCSDELLAALEAVARECNCGSEDICSARYQSPHRPWCFTLAAIEAVAPPLEPHELLVALKGYRTVLRPWLDKAIGRQGTVSYEEWELAVDRLEAAIAKAGLPAEPGTERER